MNPRVFEDKKNEEENCGKPLGNRWIEIIGESDDFDLSSRQPQWVVVEVVKDTFLGVRLLLIPIIALRNTPINEDLRKISAY